MTIAHATSRGARRGAPALAIILAIGLVIPALLLAPGTARAEPPPTPPLSHTTSVEGATIIGQRWITDRTVELTVDTPSFTQPTVVEVMLPTGYGEVAGRRWPVTYHLNGTTGDQTWFRAAYEGEALTEDYPSLIVAPAGHSGYWSDWFNYGSEGPPRYETFVTEQLIPLIDANFSTSADRAHRAVLGDSMGGYGALMLAARHPDLFTAASSLSGAVDTNWPVGNVATTASPMLQTSPPEAVYGSRLTQEVRWRGHNPVDLAGNLAAMDVQLFTGNGLPAQREATLIGTASCLVEAAAIAPETRSLHHTLVDRGVPHVLTTYDWGCHSRAMFRQEIRDTLPGFAEALASAEPEPRSFDYRSIEPRFEVFDWTVVADEDRAVEFLDLRDVTDSGLTITGSGTTRVTTPSLVEGRTPVQVEIDGRAREVTPDNKGRLTFTVDLGQPARDRQYTLGARTDRRTSVVRIGR